MSRQLVAACTLFHLAIAALHGFAHDQLGVQLNLWQWTYVGVIIVAAPLVLAAAIWRRPTPRLSLAFAAAMAASFAFGFYHHYVLISPDHVAHLPPGEAQGLFRASALGLALTEGAGTILGIWAASRTPAIEPAPQGKG